MERRAAPALTARRRTRPWSWALLLVVVPVLGLFVLAFRRTRASHERTDAVAVVATRPEVATVERPRTVRPASAQERGEPATAAAAASGVAEGALAAPLEVSPTVIDVKLSAPLVAERTGDFQRLYANWSEQIEDKTATDDAQRFFDGAFSAYDLHPISEYVRCGDSVCRGRFEFAHLKELYGMRQIQEADGIKVATTFPETHGDARTISVYWSRDAHPEGPLTQNGGQ